MFLVACKLAILHTYRYITAAVANLHLHEQRDVRHGCSYTTVRQELTPEGAAGSRMLDELATDQRVLLVDGESRRRAS